jgi:hypothetical protein
MSAPSKRCAVCTPCRPDIVRWIKKKTGPPAQTVESAEELQKAVSSSKAYALGYFKSFEVTLVTMRMIMSHACSTAVAAPDEDDPCKSHHVNLGNMCSMHAKAAGFHPTRADILPQGDAHKVFEDAARAIDEVEVYQTTSAEAAKAVGLSKEGLVIVKTFEGEEMSSVYPDALTDKDAVRAFVKSEKVRWGLECQGARLLWQHCYLP